MCPKKPAPSRVACFPSQLWAFRAPGWPVVAAAPGPPPHSQPQASVGHHASGPRTPGTGGCREGSETNTVSSRMSFCPVLWAFNFSKYAGEQTKGTLIDPRTDEATYSRRQRGINNSGQRWLLACCPNK